MGICSYLLVNFWFTRSYANQSSISAFLTNRVGDFFLTVGMFTVAWCFGNLDYATVFSLAPFINEDIIVLIGICLLIGAMAKSSQLGLHVWLPLAMEGIFKIFLPLIILYFDSLCIFLIKLIYLNTSHNNTSFKVVKITIKTPHNKLIRAIHTNSKGPSYIWVYYLTKLSYNDNCLVKGAPFNSLFLIKINGRF